MRAEGRRARHFAAIERRLFELLGGWVPTVPEAEVKLTLREQSFHHAWHAELWEELLPRDGSADAEGQPVAGALVRVLDAVADPPGTLERLVGVYRVVLPRLVVAYAAMRGAASPLADRPLVRALGLMLADDLEGWRLGEGLVQGLARSPADAEQAARHAGVVEALVVAAGGMVYSENS